MNKDQILIKETGEEDLNNIMELWNNGEVMYYVGYPEGLGITMANLVSWLHKLYKNNLSRHYSIYHKELGYCGETFYSVDKEHDLAALDIKLLPKAQGRGIGAYALSYAVSQVFYKELADRAYVDPHPDNRKAWNLYEKLGFLSKPRPVFLDPYETYLEVTKDTFKPCRILDYNIFNTWADT